MTMKTAQARHARPGIVRSGGTHLVDLAIDPDAAAAGMEQGYGYTDEYGDKVTTYREPRADDESPYFYGEGEVIVTESRETRDDAYGICDQQPEPSASDGEDQNMGGRQQPYAGFTPRRRTGGIG